MRIRVPIHSSLTWVRAWEFELYDAYCPYRDNTFDPCCNRCCKRPVCRSRLERRNINAPVIRRRR